MQSWTFNKMLNVTQREGVEDLLRTSNHGLEKECLRVDQRGHLSHKPHPPELGSALTHPTISTDFCEAQPELITPYFPSEKQALNSLNKLQRVLVSSIGNELAWPSSAPCHLAKDEEIPIAYFGTSDEGRRRFLYRKGLVLRYGYKMQMLSGVHYNFSFADSYLAFLHDMFDPKAKLEDFRSRIYFHVVRNYLRIGWLNTYLFGATPAVDRSYFDEKRPRLASLDKQTLFLPFATSLRMSNIGYYSRVQEQIAVSYDDLPSYLADLRRVTSTPHPKYQRFGVYKKKEQIQLNDYHLQTPAEHYSRIRPKPYLQREIPSLDALERWGVQYVEVRGVDLNPFLPDGIEYDQLLFLHQLLLYCLFQESPTFTKKEQKELLENQNEVALFGRDPGFRLYLEGGRIALKEWAMHILDKLEVIAGLLDSGRSIPQYTRCLESMRMRVEDPDQTPSAQVLHALKSENASHQEWNMEMARTHKKTLLKSPLAAKEQTRFETMAKESLDEQMRLEVRSEMLLKGYEDMELSTQLIIREAQKRGVHVEILDRKDNFIRLSKGKRSEYVKQATKTSKDTLMTYLLMENKEVTKIVLAKEGISVPKGSLYYSQDKAVEAYPTYERLTVVVKPNFTNYGHGISFVKPHAPHDYVKALQHAFSFGDEVIVEECLKGEEYRFLVIKGKVVAVCQRIPANVIGDGVSTIRELVHAKNQNPLSYKISKYHIRIESEEKEFLKQHGMSVKTVPKKGERVFLRSNSNVSTGGDPVDRTGQVHEGYCRIAADAAKAVDATFCGVDMMLTHPTHAPSGSNHGIIELNFNPALHIHRFAIEGTKQEVEKAVLDALGF